MALKHRFVSPAADGPDTTKLRPSNWGSTSTNYDTAPTHVFDGGALGSLMFRDTGAADGSGWIAAGAGFLAATGAGQIPAFRGLEVDDIPALPYEPAFVTLGATRGGTGLSSFAVGDLIFADTTATLATLADVDVGSVLVSGGAGAAPAWSATPTLSWIGLTGNASNELLTFANARFLHAFKGDGVDGANIFLGPEAGNFSMGGSSSWFGSYNIGIGYRTLVAQTTGHYNVAIGYNALHSNTTGFDNIAIGQNALGANTSGFKNYAFGTGALSSNTSGATNVAIGQQTLKDNTTGQNNVGIGQNALYKNTTGVGNTALGIDTLSENLTGQFNVALGGLALNFATVSQNAAIGYRALYRATTGGENVAVGYGAGYTETPDNAVTTGVQNVFIGSEAGPGGTTQLSNAIGIGYRSHPTASNQAVFGNSNITATQFYGLVTMGGTAGLGINGSTAVASRIGLNANLYLHTNGDGIARLTNNAANGFSRLIFGTNDANGVAVKKSGQEIHIVRGDDGGDMTIRAGAYKVGATAGVSFSGAVTSITVVNGIVTAAS